MQIIVILILVAGSLALDFSTLAEGTLPELPPISNPSDKSAVAIESGTAQMQQKKSLHDGSRRNQFQRQNSAPILAKEKELARKQTQASPSETNYVVGQLVLDHLHREESKSRAKSEAAGNLEKLWKQRSRPHLDSWYAHSNIKQTGTTRSGGANAARRESMRFDMKDDIAWKYSKQQMKHEADADELRGLRKVAEFAGVKPFPSKATRSIK